MFFQIIKPPLAIGNSVGIPFGAKTKTTRVVESSTEPIKDEVDGKEPWIAMKENNTTMERIHVDLEKLYNAIYPDENFDEDEDSDED